MKAAKFLCVCIVLSLLTSCATDPARIAQTLADDQATCELHAPNVQAVDKTLCVKTIEADRAAKDNVLSAGTNAFLSGIGSLLSVMAVAL